MLRILGGRQLRLLGALDVSVRDCPDDTSRSCTSERIKSTISAERSESSVSQDQPRLATDRSAEAERHQGAEDGAITKAAGGQRVLSPQVAGVLAERQARRR